MASRFYRYKCIKQGVFYNGTPRNLGEIVETTSAVAPTGFTATASEYKYLESSSYRDMDGTFYYGDGVSGWDDLRFPASRIRQGPTQKPDFDTTNLGLLFPQNDATEIAYIIAQMPHTWKKGTPLKPHIHYLQDEAEEPVFKMSYRVVEVGASGTESFTTLTASRFSQTYVSGSIHQIVGFPEIDMSAIDTLSAIIDIKLFRDDNVVTGDVLLKEFDMHFKTDSLGSGREFQK